jgi:hypothetical protein
MTQAVSSRANTSQLECIPGLPDFILGYVSYVRLGDFDHFFAKKLGPYLAILQLPISTASFYFHLKNPSQSHPR